MRTNIDIDDDLLAEAMKAGPYTTKKETVEAGLRLLARQAAYREILKWEGKLKWEGDDDIDWTRAPDQASAPALARSPSRGAAQVQEASGSYSAAKPRGSASRKASRDRR